MEIAQKEATLLNNKKILTDLLLFEAELDTLQGRYTQARKKLKFAFKEKKKLNDVYGLCMTMRKIGVLEWRLGNNTESLNQFMLCLELSNKNNFKDISAGIMNNLGVLYKEKSKIDEAERMYKESLEIYRQLDDKKGIAKSLNNLGNLYNKQGKNEETEKLYHESLEIKRQLGDKEGIAMSLNNLGLLNNEQGKNEETEKLYHESLEIRRQLGDKKGIATSLNNLGNFYNKQGKYEDAEKLYHESLEIRRQLENKQGVAQSLNNLGLLNFENGKLENAKTFYLEAILLKIELNDTPAGIVGTIHRAFTLLESSEREKYFLLAKSLNNESTKPNQQSQMANIELMHYCLSNKKIDNAMIQEKINNLKLQKEKSTLKDIDDLPVEAYYCAVVRLSEKGEKEIVKTVAEEALTIIGELRSIRKEFFQKVLKKNNRTIEKN
jgi:tetratricopeptide (TPR) repeat protein